MSTNIEARNRLLARFEPTRAGDAVSASDVDLKRFAFMLLMCTHANLMAATFPPDGSVNADAVYQSGFFTEDELPRAVIGTLARFRATLVSTQLAWYFLADQYEDPPCPPAATFDKVVTYIKGI